MELIHVGYTARTTMVTSDGVRFEAASDRSLLVYFGARITREAHEKVRRVLRLLAREPIAGVRNLQPAYCSVLVEFDPLRMTHEELVARLGDCVERLDSLPLPESREVEIPTCYGGEFGADLAAVAGLHGMTPKQAMELHSSVTYTVYFLGFVPGFAYLGELPAELATPRLATPRPSTPTGSVGIADSQTGVYPVATPGGWRLIGRTPIAMFRPDRENMSYLEIGDRVRFVPISAERFAALKSA
jgi:inhibitor of KinA